MFAKIGDQRKSGVAAKIVVEGEGRANEGWTLFLWILNHICTEFDPVFSAHFLKGF